MDENAERTIAALPSVTTGREDPSPSQLPAARAGTSTRVAMQTSIGSGPRPMHVWRVDVDDLTKLVSSTDAADNDSVRQIWNALSAIQRHGWVAEVPCHQRPQGESLRGRRWSRQSESDARTRVCGSPLRGCLIQLPLSRTKSLPRL